MCHHFQPDRRKARMFSTLTSSPLSENTVKPKSPEATTIFPHADDFGRYRPLGMAKAKEFQAQLRKTG